MFRVGFLVGHMPEKYRRKPERGITMELKAITITMEMEKPTKNTIKFVEKPESEFVPEKLGQLYIQKSFLAEIGYQGGNISVTLSQDIGQVKFVFEKPTKNTCKFNEEVANDWTPEKIGSVYVPKSTLSEMGYQGGEFYIGVSVAE